jgi:Flp pilus assembly protein CpaB
MKGRGLVVFLALILATLATAGVFMYSRGVQEEANTGGTMAQVVVSKVDLPARTDLDQMIKDDQFRIIQVPEGVVVDGAITSLDQLAGKSNSVAILAGEQIPAARISGNVPGGALAIPEGMEAITVSLEASRGVAGSINSGDHVVIYGTYSDVTDIVTGEKLPTTTTVLVPTAELLAVFRPLASSTFGSDESATSGEQLPGTLAVTLALTPEDSQRFVFTMETGRVWFGLLPPDENGQPMKPISFAQVVK